MLAHAPGLRLQDLGQGSCVVSHPHTTDTASVFSNPGSSISIALQHLSQYMADIPGSMANAYIQGCPQLHRPVAVTEACLRHLGRSNLSPPSASATKKIYFPAIQLARDSNAALVSHLALRFGERLQDVRCLSPLVPPRTIKDSPSLGVRVIRD